MVPIGVMMYRAQCGAANPTDVFVPILIATTVATLVGMMALCFKQRIHMDRVLRAHPQAIRLLPTPAAELRDIDTRSDLEALRGGKG